jgi:hypothetical protein
MFSSRITLKRALAALLPVCLAWTVAACVMLCTAHASEVQREHGACTAGATEFSQEDACCPVTASQMSALPDRRSPVPKVGGDHPAPCALAIEPPRRVRPARAQTFRRPCFSDPPLERCPALRI